MVVTNSAGTATSNAATLTVTAAGQISPSTTSLNFGNVSTCNLAPVVCHNHQYRRRHGHDIERDHLGRGHRGQWGFGGSDFDSRRKGHLERGVCPIQHGKSFGECHHYQQREYRDADDLTAGRGHRASLAFGGAQLGCEHGSLSGYNVYRSGVSGGPYTLLNFPLFVSNLAYTDSTVQAGQTYYYTVTAVSSGGTESVTSN